MFTLPHTKRWIVVGLLGSTLVALAAPAFADHRRFKGVQASAPQRVYVRDRSSNVGPVLAGIVGGFILGAAVTSNAQPRVVHEQTWYDDEPYYDSRPIQYSQPVYQYYDPYGDGWYDSLDQYQYVSGGPQVVFVIDVRSGQRVRELQYRSGRWNRCNDGYYASWANSRGHRYVERRWHRRHDDDRRHRWSDDGRRYRGDRDRDGDRRRHRGHDRDDD